MSHFKRAAALLPLITFSPLAAAESAQAKANGLIEGSSRSLPNRSVFDPPE